MANDAIPAPTLLLAAAVQEATGIDAADIYNVAVVYATGDEQVGCVTFTCCPGHAIRLFAEGIQILQDQPIPDIHIPCN